MHVKDKRKNAGSKQYSGSGIIWKGQPQLNLSELVRRYKIPADHPAASVHAMYWGTLFVECHSQRRRSCCTHVRKLCYKFTHITCQFEFWHESEWFIMCLKIYWVGQLVAGSLKQNRMVVAYFPWYFTRRPAWKPRPRRGSGFHAGSPSEVSWKICNNKCGFVFIPRLYP